MPCEVNEIDRIVTEIKEKTIQNGGTVWIKGSFKNKDGVYTDIVQYVYTYVPSLKYVTEFQVGHPFAAYTFQS